MYCAVYFSTFPPYSFKNPMISNYLISYTAVTGYLHYHRSMDESMHIFLASVSIP